MFTTVVNKKKPKSYLSGVIKDNKIFILFSFLSCLLPIIYCLLASLIKPNGSQAVMGVGHVIPFMLAFMQISFTISIIIFAKLNEIKKTRYYSNHQLISSSMWLSLFIGIMFAIFYVASAFCYMYFSNNRPNTQAMLKYGLDFLYITSALILFFPIFTSTIFIVKYRNEVLAINSIIIFFILSVLFSFLFCIFTDLEIIGLSIGLLISIMLTIFINLFFINGFFTIKELFAIYEVRNICLIFSKTIFKESATQISMSFFKAIAIICLSFSIPNTISGFVPLSYQMSRVIWFNMMYFIPFIGLGIGEGIRFHHLFNHSVVSDNNCYLEHRWRNDLKIIYATFFLTVAITIGCIFAVKPLNRLYIVNDYNRFRDGKMPEIAGWGTPTLAPNSIPNLQNFKDLSLDPLPEFKPLKDNPNNSPIIDIQNAAIRLENLNLFQNWVRQQIASNPNVVEGVKQDLQSINEWIDWLKQTNIDGVSIIHFIETKYDVNFLEQIKNIVNGIQPSTGFLQAVRSCLSYFVYLWLYSNTNDIITDAFLLLRPIINYHNVIFDSNANIVEVLINNPLSTVLTSLFLSINTFDAKAMIYIGVYGTLNSIWAILIQLNQRNLRKGMPYWLLTLVYGGCIGFLVTFGTLFGVTLTSQLGKANPFMYLDAWTFPLIVISFVVIVFLSIKYFVSYKKYNKIKSSLQTINSEVLNNVKVH